METLAFGDQLVSVLAADERLDHDVREPPLGYSCAVDAIVSGPGEGELEFRVAGETVSAHAGSYVLVPPGVVHAFTNPGPGRARFLNVHAPETGFVEYMRARARGEDVNPED